MFKKLEHVHIITPNIDESLKFYTQIIGFKIIEKKIIRGLSIAHLSLNDVRTLELIEIKDAAPIPEKPHVGYSLMALIVEDMEEAINHLKAHNVKITRKPRRMSDSERGGFRGEFQDNNGVTIEIRQLGN
jgi:catechol 2,3-dioxygenase-like lactoylglutathione lyase family enzyme